MLQLFRHTLVETGKNATGQWKGFVLLSFTFAAIAFLAAVVTVGLYCMIEIIFTGRDLLDQFETTFNLYQGQTIFNSMVIPMTAIYAWFYLFFIKKGRGNPTPAAFFRNIPNNGWGAAFVFAVIMTGIATVLSLIQNTFEEYIADDFFYDLGYFYERDSVAMVIIDYVFGLLTLIVSMFPYLGAILVFGVMEFKKRPKLGFKKLVMAVLCLFILGAMFDGVWYSISEAAYVAIFKLLNMVPMDWDIGRVVSALFKLGLFGFTYIFGVALMAHMMDKLYDNASDKRSDTLNFNGVVAKDTLEDL